MRANDIRELKVEEIQSRIAELEEERFRLNFRAATEPLDDLIPLNVSCCPTCAGVIVRPFSVALPNDTPAGSVSTICVAVDFD